MSTKIYNGRKLKNKPKNLKEVRDIIFKFKEQAMEYYRNKFYRLLARDAVEIIDNAAIFHTADYDFPHHYDDKIMEKLGQQQFSSSTIWGAVENSIGKRAEIFRKQLERGGNFFEYEFYCHVIVLPCDDEVFLLLYTQEREIQDMFDAMEEVEEYPYWDNTDQPDGMTWEEWEVRGAEWDKALGDDTPGNGVPSQNGFGIDVLAETLYIKVFKPYGNQDAPGPVEETMKHIPEWDKRVSRLTRATLYKEWVEENKEEMDKADTYSLYMKMVKRFDQFLVDEVERVEKKKAEISQILNKDITQDDLLIKVDDFVKNNGITIEKEEEAEHV